MVIDLRIDVLARTLDYCTHASNGYKVFFTVKDFDSSGGVNQTDTSPANQIPDEVENVITELVAAQGYYTSLGYSFPNVNTTNPFDVFIGQLPGSSFANPFAGNPVVPHPGIFLDVEAAPFDTDARHELFHIAQYNEAGFDAVANNIFPALGNPSTSWWLEATAEWATHGASVNAGAAAGERYDYAVNLEDVLADPTAPLTSFERTWEIGAGPLKVALGLTDRAYGSFLFAEFLEAQLGPQAIRTTWDKVGQGKSANQAIEEVLSEASPSISIGEFTTAFWVAAYGLSNVNGPPVRDFDDGDESRWLASLDDNIEDRTEIDGDGFSSRKRAKRAHSTVTVPNSGATDWFDVQAGAGGAAIVDLQLEPGYGGELTAVVAPRPDSRWERYAAVLVAWKGTSPGPASGLPEVCVRAGEPVMIAGVLAEGGWSETIELDANCPTASLIVVNQALSSDGVDDLGLNFTVAEEPLGVPGTTGTVVVGGPGVTGIVGGTIGVVSNPPAAGSPTGWVCVEVQVDRGTYFLFKPEVEIFVKDPTTGAIITSITWPGGTLTTDPKMFYLGPIDVDPWKPFTVTVVEGAPEVDGWSVRVFAHNGPPNACSS